ncbi:MAG: hypothetical protein J7M26_04295 [Armatimonadetes bacterium]|nr:hypothetical protein [Armatimonadota bacterium]
MKDGYPDRSTESILAEGLEQCRRHAERAGLLGYVGLFAVLHRRRQRYADSHVLYETISGETATVTAREFRDFLERCGVVRDD